MTHDLVTAVREIPNVEYAEAPFDADDREQTLTVTLVSGLVVTALVPEDGHGWLFTVDGKKKTASDPLSFLKGLK